jgi:hypothetical protein
MIARRLTAKHVGDNIRHSEKNRPQDLSMRKPVRIHLTRRESQIMEILHRRRRATVEELRA